MSTDRKTLEERAQMSDIERLRHSCAHVMATAILKLWPDAQFAYGPRADVTKNSTSSTRKLVTV